MSIVKHQSNLNLEIKRRLSFNNFLRQAIFEVFQISVKCTKLERIRPPFPHLKYVQAIDP